MKAERAAKAPSSKRRSAGPRGGIGQADAPDLLAFYRAMLLIRRFEERAGQLYGMGLIG